MEARPPPAAKEKDAAVSSMHHSNRGGQGAYNGFGGYGGRNYRGFVYSYEDRPHKTRFADASVGSGTGQGEEQQAVAASSYSTSADQRSVTVHETTPSMVVRPYSTDDAQQNDQRNSMTAPAGSSKGQGGEHRVVAAGSSNCADQRISTTFHEKLSSPGRLGLGQLQTDATLEEFPPLPPKIQVTHTSTESTCSGDHLPSSTASAKVHETPPAKQETEPAHAQVAAFKEGSQHEDTMLSNVT